MPRNQKLTKLIKGRSVRRATNDPTRLIVVFDDGSTMTVKTATIAPAIAPGIKVRAILENGLECILQFEDGASVTLQLADPGASVTVRDGNKYQHPFGAGRVSISPDATLGPPPEGQQRAADARYSASAIPAAPRPFKSPAAYVGLWDGRNTPKAPVGVPGGEGVHTRMAGKFTPSMQFIREQKINQINCLEASKC
jgi:hypothetical protein